ncbi:cytochrome P450 [Streptomyces griseus]|uniref:Cytochrome P450 n=1 Tax=Streptomyces sp. CMC78 TaxID=3231512 RepID=A0AB33KWA7_9ACTN|nr:cytochrome P450 [Streptomyces griseus]WTD65949.1 cytochrome P450 [Streptomyces griseus]
MTAGRNTAAEPGATAVTDFDSHDPAFARDPFSALDRLRGACPVSWSGAWDGFWVVAGHREVAGATRDRRLRTAHPRPDGQLQGVSIPPIGQTGRMIPLELDAPESLPFRRLLAGFYTPSRVAARVPEFRRLAAAYVDEFVRAGRGDLVRALTERLPSVLTLRDIGLPEDRWAEVNAVLETALSSAPHDPEGARNAAQELCLMIVEAMEECRNGGGSGLITQLLGATVGGEPVPDEAIVSMMYVLLLGIHPVSSLTATSLWHLAAQPALRRRLVADPALIPRAADEFLRWVSPIQSTVRTAVEDVRLGGRDLRAGERAFLSWAGANRDESVFPDAGRLDLDRDATAHLSFGGGPHYCVGAGTVRAMFSAMLEAVLTRMPDYELEHGAEVTWFPDVSFFYGVTSLPVVTGPADARPAKEGAPWSS